MRTRLGVQGHGRPPGEMPRQRREMSWRTARRRRPSRSAFDAARVELWEARGSSSSGISSSTPMPANMAAERSARSHRLPVSASVPGRRRDLAERPNQVPGA